MALAILKGVDRSGDALVPAIFEDEDFWVARCTGIKPEDIWFLSRLSLVPDLGIYAFADDLTIVSSSWDLLAEAFSTLQLFCAVTDLVLNIGKCQLWTKGTLSGTYLSAFDQFVFAFTLIFWVLASVLGLLLMTHSILMTHRFSFALDAFPGSPRLPTVFSSPSFPLVITILLWLVTCALLNVLHFGMQSLLFWFLSVLSGFVGRPCFHWLLPGTFCLASFSIIVAWLGKSCLSHLPLLFNVPLFSPFGIRPTLDGGPFIALDVHLFRLACVLKIRSFSSSRRKLCQLTNLF